MARRGERRLPVAWRAFIIFAVIILAPFLVFFSWVPEFRPVRFGLVCAFYVLLLLVDGLAALRRRRIWDRQMQDRLALEHAAMLQHITAPPVPALAHVSADPWSGVRDRED